MVTREQVAEALRTLYARDGLADAYWITPAGTAQVTATGCNWDVEWIEDGAEVLTADDAAALLSVAPR